MQCNEYHDCDNIKMYQLKATLICYIVFNDQFKDVLWLYICLYMLFHRYAMAYQSTIMQIGMREIVLIIA